MASRYVISNVHSAFLIYYVQRHKTIVRFCVYLYSSRSPPSFVARHNILSSLNSIKFHQSIPMNTVEILYSKVRYYITAVATERSQ